MEIKNNPNNGTIEFYRAGDKHPGLVVPGRLLSDLRSIAAIDDIRADSDKWLLGEMRYNGEPRVSEGLCTNCGGTEGFLAPTGEKQSGRFVFRDDGKRSLFMRKLAFYPCPVCMDASSLVLNQLSKVWLDDPEAVVAAAADIWWQYPGREQMGAAVLGAIERYTSCDTTGTLTLVGPYGCGKSTMATEIIRACTMAHVSSLYVSTDRFKKAVQDSIGRETGDNPDLDRIQNTPVVVFDQIDWIREVGAGGGTTFTAERARDIFNARYNMRRSRATVYVVNTDAWERSGNDALAAIYDRMKDGEVVFATTAGLRETIGKAQSGN